MSTAGKFRKLSKETDTLASSANDKEILDPNSGVDNEKQNSADSLRWKMTRLEDVSTIFVLGSGSSGKSTLIGRLLDKTDIPKPTLALDFTFARRTIPDPKFPILTIKEVCNIWELGGDALKFNQLIETPIITNHALDKFAMFIILDLSVPEKIWATLEAVVTNAKRAVTRALADGMKNNAPDMTKKLEEKIVQRLGENFPDKRFVEPFPVPIVIICTKYDIFQEYEPEKRKLISRILRLASHRLGASLNFFSKQDVSHNRRVRELFTHYAFGTPFPKGICQDSSKSLMIPHGSDSYEQIWPGSNPSQFSLDFFKHLFETQIGNFNEKASAQEDPAEDANFREPEIDSQRNLMLEDIRIKQDAQSDTNKEDTFKIQRLD